MGTETSFVGRWSTLLSVALLAFCVMAVALAYYNHDVPTHAWYRWKHQPIFANYFFCSRLAVFASMFFALIATVFRQSKTHFVLLTLSVCTVIAHYQWEAYLRQVP